MACKLLVRRFFFEPEIITTSTKISFSRSPGTCYNLVADMAKYPSFIPWILESDVVDTGANTKDCTFDVGYPPYRQSYLSKVTLNYPVKIVSLSNNNKVFELLESTWEFDVDPSELSQPGDEILLSKCISHYSAKFKFRSSIYQTFSSVIIDYLQAKTVDAFIEKSKSLPESKCLYNKLTKKSEKTFT